MENSSLLNTFHGFNKISHKRGSKLCPPLNFSILEGPILYPKENWWYLGFIFDRKLSFHQYVDFYMNKAIFTVKSMKMLGNLSRDLIPSQKHLLYRAYILPIILYSFLLWFYNKISLAYLLKVLRNIQHRATLWILRVFCTSPLIWSS